MYLKKPLNEAFQVGSQNRNHYQNDGLANKIQPLTLRASKPLIMDSGKVITTNQLFTHLTTKKPTMANRVRPPLSEKFTERCPLQVSFTTEALFKMSTYKEQAQIQIRSHQLYLDCFCFETGAAQLLLVELSLERNTRCGICAFWQPGYKHKGDMKFSHRKYCSLVGQKGSDRCARVWQWQSKATNLMLRTFLGCACIVHP